MLLAASGWWLTSILVPVSWVAIAFWPARIVDGKAYTRSPTGQ
jgi:hypothetical protein